MEFFRFDDTRIKYTGRWAEFENAMTSTAAGSRFTFSFNGEMALLVFNMYLVQAPAPHLYIQVDGGARIESTLERFIRICTAPGKHTVEVIFKSAVESFPRWYRPMTARVSLEGVEAESLNEVPTQSGKILEVVGDSITEGVLIDDDRQPFGRDPLDRPFQDDVTATYGWLVAEKLGLIPHIVGYGGMGVTHGAGGGVVTASESYPYCFEDAPVPADFEPDYILINLSTNDHMATPEEFKAGYTALLDVIRAAHPQAKVFALSGFRGIHEKSLEELIPTYNAEHDAQVVFINGSHWLTYEPLHPLRDGHIQAAEKLAEALRPFI